MYRKLSSDERQNKREIYRMNPIYRIIHTPLWRQRGDDLNPEDVWEEANNWAYILKQQNNDNCRIHVEEGLDDLYSRYSVFEVDGGEMIRRDRIKVEHSVMMVALTAFLLLANTYENTEGHPYKLICQTIYDNISCIVGFKELYEEVRQVEDEYESRGEFIDVADYIEQIAQREAPLSSPEILYARKVIGELVDENKYFPIYTMKDNETILSRINDKNNHCFQPELDLLRDNIKKVQGDNNVRLDYKNIIFAEQYKDKIVEIRSAIFPFVEGGPEHINPNEQRQWLAIVEPLKIIDGLLIQHEDRPRRKECTDGEICQQLKEFFGDNFNSLDFTKIPKSISDERKKWKDRDIGFSSKDWGLYINNPRSENNYKSLARIAQRVYGEILKVIRR